VFSFCVVVLSHMILSRFRGFGVTYRRVLGWVIGFIDTLYTVLGTTGNQSAIANLHTVQFTDTHALGLLDFTGRILATDLKAFHSKLKSHMKSSFRSLIPFLTPPIPLPPSSYAGRLASRSLTLHFRRPFYTTEHFLITTLHEPRTKHSFSC
jgi:hypothetical protein